jgi:uncharacterized protein (DUF849 family)
MNPAPMLLMAAPNGARRNQADHPALPLTAAELATTAAAVRAAGAAAIHIHVRDRHGAHLLDAAAYREAIAAIRRAVGRQLIIQVTTEAVGRYTAAEQMAMVRDLRPEAVSLALRELIPGQAAESAAAEFLAWLTHEHIWPQYILYSPEDLARFADLRRRGLIPGERPDVLCVLGRYSNNQPAEPADFLPFLNADLPADWTLCAFGPRENACVLLAAALGGHARVGFENNLRLPDGSLARDNAALVAAAAAAAAAAGRPLLDADAARQ